jgi:hypothetical protein
MKKYLILFLLSSSSILYAPYLTITQPGDYTIGGDVIYSPAGINDSVVLITTNSVILDLGGRVLSQGNLIDGLNGVVVNPNLQNVTIKNGTISNITGTGIGIGIGCNRVKIDSITTFSCDLRGVSLNGGTATTANVKNSTIVNSNIVSCCQGANGDFALSMTQCNRINLDTINIDSNGISSHSIACINMNNCLQCVLDNIAIGSNTGGTTAAGGFVQCVNLITTQLCLFKNFFIQRNAATTTSSRTVGFLLQSAGTSSLGSTFNQFEDCFVVGNQVSAATSVSVGYEILNNNNNNIFKNCRCVQNISTDVNNSFSIVTNSKNMFLNCIAQNNASTGATAAGNSNGFNFSFCTANKCVECIISDHTGTTVNGFLISGCSDCGFVRSLAEDNVGTTQGTGFRILNNTSCYLQENIAARNLVTGNDAASFGFVLSGGATNNLLKNSAMRNGATSGNQFNGFSGQNVSNINGVNTNANTAPWSNISIIG